MEKETSLRKLVIELWRDQSGQDLVEYALLLSVLTVAGVATLGTIATLVSGIWDSTNSQLSAS
jgi:Flp pilus assembly pilin Flp